MSAAPTGRSLGLLVCLQCRATVRALQVAYPRCPRCYAHLYTRKPHSLGLTAALLACAAILYIPANLLPVMITRTIFDDEQDTIMSGVLVSAALRVVAHRGFGLCRQHCGAAVEDPFSQRGTLFGVAPLASFQNAAKRIVPHGRIHRTLVDARCLRHLALDRAWCKSDPWHSFQSVGVRWHSPPWWSLTTFAARTFDERLLWDGPLSERPIPTR